jgi:polyhydroxyalkanoate synthesis regulator phasin
MQDIIRQYQKRKRQVKNKESYTIKIVQEDDQLWYVELYKNNKLIKKSDKTLYQGAVAIGSQFLLRAPYAELA